MTQKRKSDLVSIVILNYNGKDDTVELLESLKITDYPNYEVILVDNASIDGTVEIVRKKFPYVRIFRNKENLGYSGGMNVGIKNSKGKYIVLLNNDMFTHQKDWLTKIVRVANSDKKIGIVRSLLLYYDEPNIIDSLGQIERNKILRIISPFFALARNKINSDQFPKIVDIAAGNGLIKKEVFDKIGFLDEKMFVYFEESDFCYRVKNAGFRVVCAPRSKILHKSSRSIKKGSYFAIYHNYKNKIRFILKNYDFFTKLFATSFNLIFYLFLIILYAFRGRFDLSRAIRNGIVWNIRNWGDYL